MKRQRILRLCWFDLRYSLLSLKGLIFLVPFILFWYPLLHLTYANLSTLLARREILAFAGHFFDPAVVNKLLIENPPSLSLYFLFALSMLPFFAVLAGMDQFASDLGSGYFRLIGNRCRRGEIFIARYLSMLVLMIAAITAASLAAGMVSALKDQYPLAGVIAYLVRICCMLYLYAAALLAYMTIISSICSSAMGALFLGAVSYLLILFIILLVNGSGTAGEILPYLLPSALKPDLMLINGQSSLIAMAALILYAVSYNWLGWQIFKRRDF